MTDNLLFDQKVYPDDPEFSVRLELGVDDCEACGPDSSDVQVTFNGTAWVYFLRTSHGPGDWATAGTQEAIVTHLRGELPYYRSAYPEYARDFKQLIKAVERWEPAA